MSLIASLGSSLPMVVVFFGVLVFSISAAIVVLLADY
jgi:hypothetical protein